MPNEAEKPVRQFYVTQRTHDGKYAPTVTFQADRHNKDQGVLRFYLKDALVGEFDYYSNWWVGDNPERSRVW